MDDEKYLVTDDGDVGDTVLVDIVNFISIIEVIQQDDDSIIVTILSDANFINSVSKSRVRVEKKKGDDAETLDDEKNVVTVDGDVDDTALVDIVDFIPIIQ